LRLCADLGEEGGHDSDLIELLDCASVGCGVHAGSPRETERVVALCRRAGLEIGAHPGFDDREGFGRRPVDLEPAALEDLLETQLGFLLTLTELGFVKPHGALYHQCQNDPEAAEVLVRVARRHGLAPMGQPGLELEAAIRRLPGSWLREGYADRAYDGAGRLRPRLEPGALLGPQAAADQTRRLLNSGAIDVICVHGDGAGALETARAVARELRHT